MTDRAIGLAMRVHRRLGPCLLESAYHKCLCHKPARTGISFSQLVRLPIRYDDIEIGTGYFAGITVDDRVILELKAVEHLTRLHEAQILTYLRISGYRMGVLINFNTLVLTGGIRRFVL
ncbi:MAG: GxxExxY protein [Rhodopila sp.]